MISKIILQKLIEKEHEQLEIPADWQYRDLKKFGLEWNLFPYQQKAIENCIALLYFLFRDWRSGVIERNKQDILRLYRNSGLEQELENGLAITKESD